MSEFEVVNMEGKTSEALTVRTRCIAQIYLNHMVIISIYSLPYERTDISLYRFLFSEVKFNHSSL